MSMTSRLSLPTTFSKILYAILMSHLFHAWCMPHPSQQSAFDYLSNI
jgi:hypothetical protein